MLLLAREEDSQVVLVDVPAGIGICGTGEQQCSSRRLYNLPMIAIPAKLALAMIVGMFFGSPMS